MRIRPDHLSSNLEFYVQALPTGTNLSAARPQSARPARLLDFILSRAAGQPAMSLARVLRRGDRYFVVRDGWRIVALGRIGYRDMPEMDLAAGEAALISFHTNPEYRGRGLYGQLIAAMLHHLSATGYRAAYIWAEKDNAASLRGIRKAGFIPVSAGAADAAESRDRASGPNGRG